MKVRNETEPVVEGPRSDCGGAITETIFFEETLLLHLWIETKSKRKMAIPILSEPM